MMGIAEEQSIVTRTALQGTIKLLLIVELDRVETERKRLLRGLKMESRQALNNPAGLKARSKN